MTCQAKLALPIISSDSRRTTYDMAMEFFWLCCVVMQSTLQMEIRGRPRVANFSGAFNFDNPFL